VAIEDYSRYTDYHLLTPKVVVTLTRKTKLTNVRATLDTRVEVSVMSLDMATQFEMLITYSSRMALKTITRNKLRFVSFTDNILITIRNIVV
jgi:hypothetical protein